MTDSERKLVVFDMDGVLVDVSRSYRDTVRQTAAAFLRPAKGSEALPRPLFRLSDLAAVKQSGGLNNDWDLTHRVLGLLFSRIDCPAAISARGGWRSYRQSIAGCDVRPLTDYLRSVDRPLQALMNSHRQPQNPFVDRMYRGDVGTGNIIKQIFQEIYLGKELFEQTYCLRCEVSAEEGFIDRERLLADHADLKAMARRHLLAVATGRPRSEAAHPLSRFGLNEYFRAVLTLDDCLAEEKRRRERTGRALSLGKPHPFMLDAVAAAIPTPVAARIYVGDMPDDMLAAARSQAGFIGIGLTISAADRAALRERLLEAGAAAVVDDFTGLREVIESSRRPDRRSRP